VDIGPITSAPGATTTGIIPRRRSDELVPPPAGFRARCSHYLTSSSSKSDSTDMVLEVTHENIYLVLQMASGDVAGRVWSWETKKWSRAVLGIPMISGLDEDQPISGSGRFAWRIETCVMIVLSYRNDKNNSALEDSVDECLEPCNSFSTICMKSARRATADNPRP